VTRVGPEKNPPEKPTRKTRVGFLGFLVTGFNGFFGFFGHLGKKCIFSRKMAFSGENWPILSQKTHVFGKKRLKI